MSDYREAFRLLSETAHAAEDAGAQLLEAVHALDEHRQAHPSPVADDYLRPPKD